MPGIEKNYRDLEADFLQFFPELRQYSLQLHRQDLFSRE